MKLSKLVSLLVIPLFVILAMTLVLAAPEAGGNIDEIFIDDPAAGDILSGGILYQLNLTINWSENAQQNETNCTLYIGGSSLTANSSYSILNSSMNTSATAVNMTFVVADSFLEDGNDFVLNVTCGNATLNTINATKTITGMIVDTGVPQAASSLNPSTNTIDTDGSVTFSGTVTGANTTKCQLYFLRGNPGNTSYTMTHSGNNCTYSATSMAEQTYEWYITSSDEHNETDSATTRLLIDSPTSAKKVQALMQQPGVKAIGGAQLSVAGSNGILGENGGQIIVIGLILIAVVLVILAARKKR